MSSTFKNPTQIDIPNSDLLNQNRPQSKTIRGDIQYCIDKLEIVSKVEAKALNESFSGLRPIRKNIGKVQIIEIFDGMDKYHADYKTIHHQGYVSLLRIVNPKPQLFALFNANKSIFGVCKPLMIEICKEIFVTSEGAAVLSDFLISNTYINYSKHANIYSAIKPVRTFNYKDEAAYEKALDRDEKKRKEREDILNKQTLYLGNPNLKFVLYARNSKINNKPCVHMEWRIKGYQQILKLGISKKNTSYFSTLENLSSLHLAQSFEKLYKKRIKHSGINKVAFGKYRLDCTNKKKLSIGDLHLILLEYNSFAKMHHIESTGHFVQYCKKNRIRYRNFLIDIALI